MAFYQTMVSSTTVAAIIHGPSLHPSLQPVGIPMAVSSRFFRMPNWQCVRKTHWLRICSANTGDSTHASADFSSSSVEREGSTGKDENLRAISSNEILKRLKRYGISGILSYGILNTAYYLTTFLVVWFLKIMAMVWAGSQVTKLVRAGGALALAPFVDRGLSWFTVKFKFESQGKAFMAIAGFCFGLAFLLFLTVTVLWA